MNKIKLTKKNISISVLLILTLVILPITLLLAKQRTVLKQRATGGTGTMALKIVSPISRAIFAPGQNAPMVIKSAITASGGSQKVYNYAVKLSAVNATINSASFECGTPFKKFTTITSGWDVVCYAEGGALIANDTALVALAITMADSRGEGRIDFSNVRIVGDGAGSGVADLSGDLTASAGYAFSVDLPKFAELAFTPWTNPTPTPAAPGVDKCFYEVNVNWGPDQAGTALTQKVMSGTTTVSAEQVWCGADGTFPTSIPKMSASIGSCAGWGNPGAWVKAVDGKVAYYKLYYKGEEVSDMGVVDTGVYCGSAQPTPTPGSFIGGSFKDASGRGIAGVAVGLYPGGGWSETQTTDVYGNYVFSYSAPGSLAYAVRLVSVPVGYILPAKTTNDWRSYVCGCGADANTPLDSVAYECQSRYCPGAIHRDCRNECNFKLDSSSPLISPTPTPTPTPTTGVPPTATPTIDPTACPRGELGNLNCGKTNTCQAIGGESQKVINTKDLNYLLGVWGGTVARVSCYHDPDITGSGDIPDGVINMKDLNKLLTNWGEGN